jgi:hypothetical protein
MSSLERITAFSVRVRVPPGARAPYQPAAFSQDGIFSIAATVKGLAAGLGWGKTTLVSLHIRQNTVININVVYPVEDLGRELRANAQDFAMYFVCFYGTLAVA